MSSLLYNFLLYISLPIAALYCLWRTFVTRKAIAGWRNKFGRLPNLAERDSGKKLVWIHAASVGEAVASQPIQKELRELLPGVSILLTTITRTGNAVAKKSAGPDDTVGYLPFDYPIFVSKALDRVKPDVFVTIEAELWPNFLAAAKSRNIPTVLVSGRISDRSMRRGKWFRLLMSWVTSNIDAYCMQTESDAERIKSLGARPESVHVFGSTKFDQEGGKLDEGSISKLRANLRLPDGVPVFVAGSTNPGEEDQILSAFQRIRSHIGNLRLIIAPRHIERADEIQTLVEASALSCVRRSDKEDTRCDYDVMILDTLGELGSVYAVGEIAFVGGTLIPKGGHSIIQPILQGKPVFYGPHTFKTRDVAQMAINAEVGLEVKNADGLSEKVTNLLLNPELKSQIEEKCQRLIKENQGASRRCAETIIGLLQRKVEEAGVSE